MNKNVGLITIGQSPRTDLLTDFDKILMRDINVKEVGILDEFSYDEASQKLKPDANDAVLVSRMRDSRQIIMGNTKVFPLIQKCIDKLNQENLDLILLMCTGQFPQFRSKKILIEPHQLVHNIIKGICVDKPLGIVVPNIEQAEYETEIWLNKGIKAVVKVASPYLEIETIEKVASEFEYENVSLIFMDCIGYSIKMKEIVRKISEKPVVIPRVLLANIVNELVSDI